jgi:hypothetical protein
MAAGVGLLRALNPGSRAIATASGKGHLKPQRKAAIVSTTAGCGRPPLQPKMVTGGACGTQRYPSCPQYQLIQGLVADPTFSLFSDCSLWFLDSFLTASGFSDGLQTVPGFLERRSIDSGITVIPSPAPIPHLFGPASRWGVGRRQPGRTPTPIAFHTGIRRC